MGSKTASPSLDVARMRFDLIGNCVAPIGISVKFPYIIRSTPLRAYFRFLFSHTSPIRLENKWLIFRNRYVGEVHSVC